MFTNFSEAERKIHFPQDRRFYVGMKPYVFVVLFVLLLATVGVAWFEYLLYGLPKDPSLSVPAETASDPKGFPWWLCLSHWVNFFFLALIIRSGLSILADHARLYRKTGCSPGSGPGPIMKGRIFLLTSGRMGKCPIRKYGASWRLITLKTTN